MTHIDLSSPLIRTSTILEKIRALVYSEGHHTAKWQNELPILLERAFAEYGQIGISYHRIVHDIFYGQSDELLLEDLWGINTQISTEILNGILNLCDSRVAVVLGSALLDSIEPEITTRLLPVIHHFSLRQDKPRRCSFSELLGHYPIFAKRLISIVCGIIHNLVFAIQRFYDDQNHIGTEFGHTFSDIERLWILPSDPHNGYQRNIAFEFSDSSRVVFKPRSMAGEIYFSQVINALADKGIHIPKPEIVDRNDYGWMKWVSPSGNSPNPERVATQIGYLLACTITFSIVDLHAENVLLSEEGIVVIDAEAIGLRYPVYLRDKFIYQLPNVSQISILPQATGYSPERWWDITLCGITPGRKTVPAGLEYSLENSEVTSRISYHFMDECYAGVSRCISQLNQNEIQSHIISGFLEAREAISHLPPIFPTANQRASFRYIHRPTSAYLRTLFRLTDPEFGISDSENAKEVAPYIQDLIKINSNSPAIAAAEIAALLYGDVPRLTTKELDATYPGNSEQQTWEVPSARYSSNLICLAFRAREILEPISDNFHDNKPQSNSWSALVKPLSSQVFVNIANELNRYIVLLEKVDISKNRSPTFRIGLNPSSNIPELQEVNLSLYDGAAGLLFLQLMSMLSDESETAIISVSSLIAMLNDNNPIPTSISEGPIGVLYILSYIQRLVGSSHGVYNLCAEYLERFVHQIEKQRWLFPSETDVISGLAGWLLILDALPSGLKTLALSEKIEQATKMILRGN